jgi:hypothetical protein
VTNSQGCDSIITIQLTVHPVPTQTIQPTVCDSYTSPSGQYTWTQSGTYTDTLTSFTGCDSIITVQLTVHTSSVTSIQPTSCGPYTSPSGLYTWTQSGTYSDTLTSSTGCDSIIQVSLTIPQIDTWVTQTGATLLSSASSAAYQWVDCGNNFTAVAGATSQSFTPASNGQYAVIVTLNTCSDTSACYTVNTLGLPQEADAGNLHLYPNPADGLVYIQWDADGAPVDKIMITDIRGNRIAVINTPQGTQATVDMQPFPAGVYLVQVFRGEHFSVQKIIRR